MNRDDVNWRGYWVAAPTPFTREGALDERLWREELRLYVGQGVHGILVNGTTGEWFSQSDDERRRVAEIAVEELSGKTAVVIGCTTYTAAHSAELGRHAKESRADGILSTPPPDASPSSRLRAGWTLGAAGPVTAPARAAAAAGRSRGPSTRPSGAATSRQGARPPTATAR